MGDTGDRDVKQFNVYLPSELIRGLKHHAVDTEQSLSAIVTTALERYLKEQHRRKGKD
jgi:predicted transcriptional regulator